MATEVDKIFSGCQSYHYHHWQSSPFSAIAFLRRFWQICLELDYPVFTSLDFGIVIF
jgi:hypothetical protein